MQVYMVLFNEANVSNLLETTLFGASACEGLEDAAVDLVDYCVGNLSKLFSGELLGRAEIRWNPWWSIKLESGRPTSHVSH
jgi:hypothetical protein